MIWSEFRSVYKTLDVLPRIIVRFYSRGGDSYRQQNLIENIRKLSEKECELIRKDHEVQCLKISHGSEISELEIKHECEIQDLTASKEKAIRLNAVNETILEAREKKLAEVNADLEDTKSALTNANEELSLLKSKLFLRYVMELFEEKRIGPEDMRRFDSWKRIKERDEELQLALMKYKFHREIPVVATSLHKDLRVTVDKEFAKTAAVVIDKNALGSDEADLLLAMFDLLPLPRENLKIIPKKENRKQSETSDDSEDSGKDYSDERWSD